MAVTKWWWAALGVIALGCATDGPRRISNERHLEVRSEGPKELLAPPPPTSVAFDPRTFAANKITPGECNSAALDLRRVDPDKGWAALQACVKKGRFPRGDFSDLRLILPEWTEELSTRPESATVVARIVALRGGDVDGDLKRLQAHRVPVFTLAAAMKSPTVYKGRYVLVRATIDEVKQEAGVPTLRLSEVSLQGVLQESEMEGTAAKFETQRSGRGRLDVKTSNYGSGSASGSYSSNSTSRVALTQVRYENTSNATGRIALGRMPQADPFLEPGKEYVILGLFDGTRRSADTPEEKADDTAVLRIVGYHPPAPMLVD